MARGFSLIELIVVVGIFTVISAIVLANHSQFNSNVLLGSLAYDIGLSIREAQVYGLSVKKYSEPEEFQVGYGVHFQTAGQYLLFVDRNKNKRYDADTDGIQQTYTLGRGHSVKKFCGYTAGGAEECSDNAAALAFLDIVFIRPSPDASILSTSPTIYSIGAVTVQSVSGKERTITVQSTGQISVSQ
ncbi:MAG: prepilin-type N-terminal cleavage/methylation domain-containing protein [Patescibacteria group bacterium]